jgi:hypothetical protein
MQHLIKMNALQVGPQAFGMVPFVDLANHAADPNADVSAAAAAAVSVNTTGGSRDPDESNSSRNAAEGGGSSSSNNSMTTTATTQDFIDLVAVKDIAAGAEVTISYSGLAGYTNQRFMAQYGFVPSSGNRADRLELDIPTGWVLNVPCICCHQLVELFAVQLVHATSCRGCQLMHTCNH